MPRFSRLGHRLFAPVAGQRSLVAALIFALLGATPIQADVMVSPDVAATVATPTRERARENQRVFDRVWGEVRSQYYDPSLHGLNWRGVRATYRPRALSARDDTGLYRVLNDMLDLLDDQHAGVSSPAATRRQDRLRQRRPVIGVTLYPEADGVYRIERVRPGSPAAEAGIGVGWRLEGSQDDGWGPDRDVVDGAPVSLRFADAQGVRHTVTLTPRDMDPLPAFTTDASRPGVLVLRVEGFEAGLGHWLGTQLSDLTPDTEVVLDLRGNPGGLLSEADAVLSCFLPSNQVWATRTSRSGRAAPLRVRPGCGDLNGPISNPLAVLVDSTSRSAAELTPAALQDFQRALVVGERTAGAVLISQETALPDGGRLTLSRADFRTARGVRLEKYGVSPDLVVADASEPQAPTDADPALDAAIAALRQRGPITAAAPSLTN